ncbi:HAD-IIB family hydrolase [Labrenzia sp. VG12]|uniref:HAD-IIB family hydrolase n=1 Tax=Labrenzia sp. VG12 TaxID=2021862 RepID=UPI001AD90778|nr:HAD-IIB family hydrolase [Labrenzia sp. VG12]
MREPGSEDGPWLLVSDIDDTLTGDRAALDRLWQSLKARKDRLRLALNSSRPAVSVDKTLADDFPDGFQPDAVITGLGTEIRLGGSHLEGWQQQFADWPDKEVRRIVTELGYAPHDDIFQTGGKASFAVPGKDDVDRVLESLRRAGIDFRSIYSGRSDLDILAPGAGKDVAMRYLADQLGIPVELTVAAGDSGNDLALFEAAGKAIAVGNARRELLSSLPKDKTYLAKAHHAAGVEEGLTALGILP